MVQWQMLCMNYRLDGVRSSRSCHCRWFSHYACMCVCVCAYCKESRVKHQTRIKLSYCSRTDMAAAYLCICAVSVLPCFVHHSRYGVIQSRILSNFYFFFNWFFRFNAISVEIVAFDFGEQCAIWWNNCWYGAIVRTTQQIKIKKYTEKMYHIQFCWLLLLLYAVVRISIYPLCGVYISYKWVRVDVMMCVCVVHQGVAQIIIIHWIFVYESLTNW